MAAGKKLAKRMIAINKNAKRDDNGDLLVPEKVMLKLLERFLVALVDYDPYERGESIKRQLINENEHRIEPFATLQRVSDELMVEAFLMGCVEVKAEEEEVCADV